MSGFGEVLRMFDVEENPAAVEDLFETDEIPMMPGWPSTEPLRRAPSTMPYPAVQFGRHRATYPPPVPGRPDAVTDHLVEVLVR